MDTNLTTPPTAAWQLSSSESLGFNIKFLRIKKFSPAHKTRSMRVEGGAEKPGASADFNSSEFSCVGDDISDRSTVVYSSSRVGVVAVCTPSS